MKYILILLLATQTLYSQSYFGAVDEVINHLEGEWKIDYGKWMGIQFDMRDSMHIVKFEKSYLDSIPLICTTYREDSIIGERIIEIEYNNSDGFPGPWRLKGLPDFLVYYMAINENVHGEYPLSEDKMVLLQMAYDGISLLLTKITSVNTENLKEPIELFVLQNPILNNEIIFNKIVDKPYRLNLFSSSGQLVHSKRLIIGQKSIQIPNLQSGNYFLHIINHTDMKVIKLAVLK